MLSNHGHDFSPLSADAAAELEGALAAGELAKARVLAERYAPVDRWEGVNSLLLGASLASHLGSEELDRRSGGVLGGRFAGDVAGDRAVGVGVG